MVLLPTKNCQCLKAPDDLSDISHFPPSETRITELLYIGTAEIGPVDIEGLFERGIGGFSDA